MCVCVAQVYIVLMDIDKKLINYTFGFYTQCKFAYIYWIYLHLLTGEYKRYIRLKSTSIFEMGNKKSFYIFKQSNALAWLTRHSVTLKKAKERSFCRVNEKSFPSDFQISRYNTYRRRDKLRHANISSSHPTTTAVPNNIHMHIT